MLASSIRTELEMPSNSISTYVSKSNTKRRSDRAQKDLPLQRIILTRVVDLNWAMSEIEVHLETQLEASWVAVRSRKIWYSQVTTLMCRMHMIRHSHKISHMLSRNSESPPSMLVSSMKAQIVMVLELWNIQMDVNMKVLGKMIFELERDTNDITMVILTQEISKLVKLMAMVSIHGLMVKFTMESG